MISAASRGSPTKTETGLLFGAVAIVQFHLGGTGRRKKRVSGDGELYIEHLAELGGSVKRVQSE